jgi:hypothetical protein
VGGSRGEERAEVNDACDEVGDSAARDGEGELLEEKAMKSATGCPQIRREGTELHDRVLLVNIAKLFRWLRGSDR